LREYNWFSAEFPGIFKVTKISILSQNIRPPSWNDRPKFDALYFTISNTTCTTGSDYNPSINPRWQDYYCNGDGIVGKEILIEKLVKDRIAICGLKVWGQPVYDSTMTNTKTPDKTIFLDTMNSILSGKELLWENTRGVAFNKILYLHYQHKYGYTRAD
jgi:hypothetical protein